MDTSLLDLTPGLAASARVVGELPAGANADPLPADPDGSRDVNGTVSAETERDCKPD